MSSYGSQPFNSLTAVGGYTLIAFMSTLVVALFCCGCVLRFRMYRAERLQLRNNQVADIVIAREIYSNQHAALQSASDEEIGNLPTELFAFPKTDRITISRSSSIESSTLENSDAERCPICLAEYQVGESLIHLHCNHRFHRTCITTWLHKKRVCPLCFRDIDPVRQNNLDMTRRQSLQMSQDSQRPPISLSIPQAVEHLQHPDLNETTVDLHQT